MPAKLLSRLVKKETKAVQPPSLCPAFHGAVELIGRKWTGAIIFLLLKSRLRFAALRDAIPDITDRMLSERLQELEQNAIVERTVLPDPPVRVEYSLTDKGRALAAAVDAISEWAHDWGGPASANDAAHHAVSRRTPRSAR